MTALERIEVDAMFWMISNRALPSRENPSCKLLETTSMIRILVVPIIATAVVINGCAALTSPMRMRTFDPKKAQLVDYDAYRRGQIVVPEDTNVRICAEPQPDVAYNSSNKVSGSGKAATGASVDVSGESNLTAQVINQNTQLVLFMREALYRLCEISLNEKLDANRVAKLYGNVLETVAKLSAAAADTSKAALTNAEASKTEAATRKWQIEQYLLTR